MDVYVLSAGRGEGKTTYLCRLAAHVANHHRSVGGIATPAVFEDDRRVGYDLLDLRQRRRHVLARLTPRLKSGPILGAYRFNDAAIRAGNAAIIAAVQDDCDFIGIDEVGPLEFRGDGWSPALSCALEECRSEQALVITLRPSLAEDLSARIASPRWARATFITPPWPDPAQVPLGP